MRARRHLRRFPAPSSMLVIAAGASGPSLGGRVMGGFTLPVAASWGGRRLPAGKYTFVAAPGTSRAWVYVRGDASAVVFLAASLEGASRPPRSLLHLVYDGTGYRVLSLKLRDSGKVLLFGAGRGGRVLPEPSTWSGSLAALLQLSAGRRHPALKPGS